MRGRSFLGLLLVLVLGLLERHLREQLPVLDVIDLLSSLPGVDT